MPFVKKSFYIEKPIKAFLFIMKKFNYTQGEAQRLISKGRLFIGGESIYDKALIVQGNIEILYFEPISRGVKPIFINRDFLVYDKPSGILVHPNRTATEYSMLDEIREYSGKNANATHRIDMETSGLLLASRHKDSEKFLKLSFENRKIEKKYLAWVVGEVKKPFMIEKSIKIRDDYSKNKHKVEISKNGKFAKTEFIPLEYDKTLDCTLLKCIPFTGRTHQIRVHLFSVEHPILGDPLYGTDFKVATKYLDGTLSNKERFIATGATRLLLHANSISLFYGNRYKIYSKIDFFNAKKYICNKDIREFYD